MHGTLPQSQTTDTRGARNGPCSPQTPMSSVQYHRERAAEETSFAEHASSSGPAAVHTSLAAMHKQLVAKGVIDSLAPGRRPSAWRAHVRSIISRYFLLKSLRSAFLPLENCAKAQHFPKNWRLFSGI